MLITKLEHKYAAYKEHGTYVNERQREIVQFIEESPPVKLSNVVKRFPLLSVHTIKKDLQLLVQQQVISKIGQKKGTIYLKLINK